MATWAIACLALAVGCSGGSAEAADADAGIEAAIDEAVESDAPAGGEEDVVETTQDPSIEATDLAPDPPSGDLAPDACVPDCAGKECGPDGCGGYCGHCGCDPRTDPAIGCWQGTCTDMACMPWCGDRECGDDGCAGLCGMCYDPAKPECSPEGRCVPGVCTYPVKWSVVGAVATMSTPGSADLDVMKTRCHDFSGDGNGDNGLKPLATTINPEIQKALDAGDFALLLEFRGVTDFVDTASFQLVGLAGRPDASGNGTFLVDPMSYGSDTPIGECVPAVVLDGAKIAGGALGATASEVVVPIRINSEGVLDMGIAIRDVHIDATITDDGVNATGGVITGVVPKAQIEAALAKIEGYCLCRQDESLCAPPMGQSILPMLFDLDLDKDGKKDAMSICFEFTLKAATVVGLKP
jgi:hypothetical protein